MQLEAAAVSPYFPASHSVQEGALVAVVDALYLPVGHSSQAVPAPFDTLPAGQTKQEFDWGQKFALLASAVADATVIPAASVTFHAFSDLYDPAVACP